MSSLCYCGIARVSKGVEMDRMGAKGILAWVRGRLSSSGGQLHLKRDGKCTLAVKKSHVELWGKVLLGPVSTGVERCLV